MMHRYKVGIRARVLEDNPCMADLHSGEIIKIIGLLFGDSYRVLGKRSQLHWSVKESQIKPITSDLEENE